MKRTLWIFVLFFAAAPVATAGSFVRAAEPSPGEYIVRLHDGAAAPSIAAQLARAHHVSVSQVYTSVIQGFAFTGSERAARAISRDRQVMYVEEAAVVHLSSSQAIPGNTGLDRIDQRRRPLDHNYVYNETGAGTTIYIIDSGVNPIAELGSRLIYSQSFIANTDTSDCANHGTSVASLAAGSVHGVAKGASIVNLKATGCNTGTAAPLAALDWVYANHSSVTPAVVNMSWFLYSSPHDETLQSTVRTAVIRLVNRGIVVVAVTPDMGNNGFPNPCATPGYEPARSGRATGGLIAVGALTLTDGIFVNEFGGVAGSGPCVDLFAPGVNLAGGSGGGETTFNGVSGAAPLVAGVAALIQQREPSIALTPSLVESRMIAAATKDLIGVPADSRNALLHSLPNIAITAPGSVNATQQFTVSVPPISGATYLWNVSNGTIVSGGSTSSATISAGCSGSSVVDVIVDSPSGRTTGMVWIPISMPTSVTSGDTYINPGGSATVRADLTGTGPWTVSWSDGFQHTVTSSPALHTVSPAATTTYVAYVTVGSCPGSSSGSATVTVTDCIPLSGALSVPSSAYSSATVWAYAASDEGAYYMWNLTNGSTNWYEGPYPYLSFKMGCIGSTTVGVQITRACGMQSSGSATIPIVQSNGNVWGSTTITAGQSATIRADYTGTTPWSIRWSDGVWQTNIGATWVTRSVKPGTTTTYTAVEVRDPSYCLGTASGSATITVH